MLNILTAIDDFEVTKVLGNEDYINVISKDISYREGILEQIEINKKIDLIIIDEKIDGEIKIKELIKKIKEKIKNIKIIIVTNNENKIKEEIKRFKRIKIYETNKIKIKKLLKIIDYEENIKDEKIDLNNEKNFLSEETIKENKKNFNNKFPIEKKSKNFENEMIIEKNEEDFNNEIIQKYIAEDTWEKNLNKKNIISISGARSCGKTMIAIVFSKINFKSKTLLIDFNSEEKQDILTIFNKKNKKEIQTINKNIKVFSTNRATKIKEILKKEEFENIFIDIGYKEKNEKLILKMCKKNIVLIEPNLLGIKNCKKLLNYYLKELKIKKNKILILVNKKNKFSIDKSILKNIFKNIKIIGEIKNNFKYERLMNNGIKNFNIIFNNKERKEIKKILKKI